MREPWSETAARWLATLVLAGVAGYLGLVALAWCWERSADLARGEDHHYLWAAVKLAFGIAPLASGVAYFIAMRRSGQALRSALAFGCLVVQAVSIPVIFFAAFTAPVV